jgi:tRNA-modifying protein YgfZ
LDSEVMPPEAGLESRWLDERKGCYTGQEVMVRIRDRGKVNRVLRGLLLGEGRDAQPGATVWISERSTPVGELRTVVQSPRFGQVVALAYLRREVEPGFEVYISGPGGSRGSVRALSGEGWVEGLGSSGA